LVLIVLLDVGKNSTIEQAFGFVARGLGLGKIRVDASLLTGPDLIAVVVAPISNDVQGVAVQNGLRLLRYIGELTSITANVGHFVGNDQVMLTIWTSHDIDDTTVLKMRPFQRHLGSTESGKIPAVLEFSNAFTKP
jgi:hypothetical protein